MQKRLLCLVLLFVMAAAAFAGCRGKDAPGAETSPPAGDGTGGAQDADPLDPGLEAEQFGGYFTFFGREADGYSFPYYEISGNESKSTLDSGIFTRNSAIEYKYGVQILSRYELTNAMLSKLTTDVLSGTAHEYDAVLAPTTVAFQMAVNGLLYDMADIPHINLEKPYYDQSLLADTSINGIRYFAHGHYSISTYNAISGLYFNQSMRSSYSLSDPYALVRDGEWTWETMFEMCRTVTSIVNDGNPDVGQHQYGIAIGIYAWQPMFFSTGSSLITKDENDTPQLNIADCVNIIQDVNRVMNDHETTFFPSSVNMSAQYNAMQVFEEGRSLFMSDPLYCIPEYLLDSDVDYGILPFPMYREGQDAYYAQTHPAHSTVLGLSKAYDAGELNKAGKIMEDFAYQSSVHVYSVLMDNILLYRNAKTAENYEMLGIIFSNVRCDMGLALNNETKMDNDIRSLIRSNSTEIASTLNGNSTAYQGIIANIVSSFEKYRSAAG